MSFDVVRLLGSRASVTGTDSKGVAGSTVLDTTEWDELNATRAYAQDTAEFEAACEAFFAPLTDAAAKLGNKIERTADPASYIVLEEAQAGVPAKAGVLHRLNRDSIILRLIEQGDTDRLMWVGDNLEVTDNVPPVVPKSGTVVEVSAVADDTPVGY